MKHITIIGLGNPLMKDDGIGPRLVHELQKGGLPQGVHAVEGGGSLVQHWDLIAHSNSLIAVDALQGGEVPGTIYLLNPGDIAQKGGIGPFRHEDDFLSDLGLMARFGIRPKVFILGVEPKEIAYSLELSPEISARMPLIVKAVRDLYTPLLHSVDEITNGAASGN